LRVFSGGELGNRLKESRENGGGEWELGERKAVDRNGSVNYYSSVNF